MNQKPTAQQWMILIAVSLVLVWAVIALGCVGQYGAQYQQFGRELGRKQAEVRLPGGDYQYVIDLGSGQYWPFESKYIQAIPEQDRVYVLDDETLAKFKGYKPGPL